MAMVAVNQCLIWSRGTVPLPMEHGDSKRTLSNAFGLHLPGGRDSLGPFCARRWHTRFSHWRADRDVDCAKLGGSVQKPEIVATFRRWLRSQYLVLDLAIDWLRAEEREQVDVPPGINSKHDASSLDLQTAEPASCGVRIL